MVLDDRLSIQFSNAFTAEDGEAFRRAGVLSPEKGRIQVVEGELITWFGVRMKKALETLPALLR